MPNFRYFIPDLVEIQRQSFFYFLEKGILEEFKKRNPITNLKKDIELFFYPENYKLTKPKYTIEETLLKNKSYTSKLYIPVQLTDRKRKRIYLKWVLIANLPLMTKRGHFILNGAARVIVNQIVRSPGVYFQEKLHEIYINKWNERPDFVLKRYYADIICLRGTWLRIEIDKDQMIWAQMKKGPKIPILWLLIAMGLNEKTIFGSLSFPERLVENFQPKEKVSKSQKGYLYVQYAPQAWKQLYELMTPNAYQKSTKSGRKLKSRLQKNTSEFGRRWLFKKFMNPRTYDLGNYGRMALNQKLGLTLSLNQTTLTAQDLLSITSNLLKIERGDLKTDDIDHLKNRRVRTSGDLIQSQFSIGLIRLEKWIRDKLTKTVVVKNKDQNHSLLMNLINTRPVNGVLREFFGTSPLSQFMDQMNPLSEMTHKRRLSSMGPGGVTRDNATLAIRGIHPSHYGRICPIETPEGKNTGLVNSMTAAARVNSQGFIESPFFKVYKGQIQKKLGVLYMTADQEEKLRVAASDVFVSKDGFLPKYGISTRFGKDFLLAQRNQIDFIGSTPHQMISLATSLIPFLEHDDANRALMGSNMQRQAVPLIRPERPLVGTGLEARAVCDSGHALTSKFSGYVSYSSASKIVIYSFQ